jgi:hypothetical protein
MAPVVVPLTTTVTPISPSPFLSSIIIPRTIPCAVAKKGKVVDKKASAILVSLYIQFWNKVIEIFLLLLNHQKPASWGSKL